MKASEPMVAVCARLRKSVLERLDRVARREHPKKGARTHILRKAVRDYLQEHEHTHNPQTVIGEAPKEPTLEEQKERVKAGLRFVRLHNKWTIRQIAKVTGLNRGFVYRAVKGILQKGVRTENFPYKHWRKRWQMFLNGMSPREAFTV